VVVVEVVVVVVAGTDSSSPEISKFGTVVVAEFI